MSSLPRALVVASALIGATCAATFLYVAALYSGRNMLDVEIGTDGIRWTKRRNAGGIASVGLIIVGAWAFLWSILTFFSSARSSPTGDATLSASERLWKSSSTGKVCWTDVRRAKYHANRRVIAVMGRWRCRIRLYCGPEEWGTVASWVRWGEAEGARLRAAGPLPETRSPVQRR